MTAALDVLDILAALPGCQAARLHNVLTYSHCWSNTDTIYAHRSDSLRTVLYTVHYYCTDGSENLIWTRMSAHIRSKVRPWCSTFWGQVDNNNRNVVEVVEAFQELPSKTFGPQHVILARVFPNP